MKNLFMILFMCLSYNALASRINISSALPDKKIDAGISSCTGAQTRVIEKALHNVSQKLHFLKEDWVQYSLSGVKNNFVIPEERVWIDQNPKHGIYQTYWSKMRLSFGQMLADDTLGINLQCQTAQSRYCKSGQTYAYVKFYLGKPQKLIYACPILFQNTLEQVGQILFHELSHYSSSTEDYAGDWWIRDNINLSRGVEDAYHFELFFNDDIAKVLKRQIWLWWWPKQRSPTY